MLDPRQPFTTAQAREAGISRSVLAGPRFQRIFHGVHIDASVSVDLRTRVQGARLILPPDAAASHTTAMRLHGFDLPGYPHLEFSTNTLRQRRIPGVFVHRRRGELHPRPVHGLSTLGPDRTFVDVALQLRLPDLVAFGDHLVYRGLTTIDHLLQYVDSRHLDGVRRARRIARLLRSGAESPPETVVRLLLRFARLPEAEVNGVIHDEFGQFLARGDLVYRRWKVVVEYDGRHHERDARTREYDIRRRELLEAEGWIVIVVTAGDLNRSASIPTRVHSALVRRGYPGPAPVQSLLWSHWFVA